MKRLFRKYFPLIPAGLILGMLVFSPGCANTTQAPTGGPKDTIPPRVTDPVATAPTGIIDSTIGIGTAPAESQPITFGINR